MSDEPRDLVDLVSERLEIAKLSLNELIENDVADLFGMPHTDEGRKAAMEAFLRVQLAEAEIFGE